VSDDGERKVCTQCGESKPLDDFYVKDRATGRRFSWCKACAALRQVDYLRRRREGKPPRPKPTEKACTRCGVVLPVEQFPLKNSRTGWRRSHCPPCDAADDAAYRTANREKIRASDAAYREANRAVLAERQKRWRAEHPEEYRAIHSAWKSRNTAAVNAATHRRRNLIAGNGGHWTAAEWEALKAEFDYHCLMCARQEPEITLTVDHIVPVSMGGSNSIDNIQPLCKSCNSIKARLTQDLRGGR
jgi:5-methylcytosine-specific restriction endonuclease McrA